MTAALRTVIHGSFGFGSRYRARFFGRLHKCYKLVSVAAGHGAGDRITELFIFFDVLRAVKTAVENDIIKHLAVGGNMVINLIQYAAF